MTKVSKLVIVYNADEYLLLTSNDHPTFGSDPDLPGGTVEDGESALDAMIREVQEEAGIDIKRHDAKEIYSGTDYSTHGTHYTLFMVNLDKKPEVKLSWEHSAYQWVSFDELLERAAGARNTYMHMVHDALLKINSSPAT